MAYFDSIVIISSAKKKIISSNEIRKIIRNYKLSVEEQKFLKVFFIIY